MGNTLNWNISYPPGAVAPDVPLVMQEQAESVDEAMETLAATIPQFSGTVTPATGLVPDGACRVTRSGRVVAFSARFTRNSGANTGVATVPVGYRPSESVFGCAFVGGVAKVIQVSSSGIITTPFSADLGDFMVCMSWTTSATVLP